MKNDRILRGSLDYFLYRHGKSKTRFRGPRPDLRRHYNVFLGSSETYGKFIPKPFARLLQDVLGMPCANFSALNAGVEMYLKDPSVLLSCSDARVTVIGVMGAHNMSNRFYSVHPRRNDRFVRPSDMLRLLFREVDFSDIHYTRHLLNTLFKADPMKFALVVDELKAAWLARMKSLLDLVEGKTVLLWMADNAPPDVGVETGEAGLNRDPLFVDQAMIDALSPLVTKVVECIATPAAIATGRDGMIFEDCDAAAAAKMAGPAFHGEVAEALTPVLRGLV